MSVLKNLKRAFILHLVKTLENKILFGFQRYRSPNIIAFPPVRGRNYGLSVFRLKPAIYNEISKAGSPGRITLVLFFGHDSREWVTENINENVKYDDIAFKYLRSRNEERIHMFLNIVLPGIEFSPNDFPHSWQNGVFSVFKTWSNFPDGEEVPARRRRLPSTGDEIIWRRSESDEIETRALESIPSGEVELREESSARSSENDISSFREEECVVCKESIPNIMFCNCGHIAVCEGCNNDNLKSCPLCRTPSPIKRRI